MLFIDIAVRIEHLLDLGRHYSAWRDAVDCDVVFRKLESESRGKAVDTTLCGVISSMGIKSGVHRVGADVDDAPIFAFDHVRQDGPCTPDRRPEIAVDGLPQRLRRVLEERPYQPAAGVIHKDVNPAPAV